MIGGNLVGLLQVKNEGAKNAIGERVHTWTDNTTLKGFLDLMTGDSDHINLNAKIQDSTHVFICDYKTLKNTSSKWLWDTFSFVDGHITHPNKSDKWLWDTFSFVSGNLSNYEDDVRRDINSENSRMIIDGKKYEVRLIDDPMNLHDHLEIYLKYLGGGLGV